MEKEETLLWGGATPDHERNWGGGGGGGLGGFFRERDRFTHSVKPWGEKKGPASPREREGTPCPKKRGVFHTSGKVGPVHTSTDGTTRNDKI